MTDYTLEDVRAALGRGDKATARQIVDLVLKANPTVEGWLLAAQAVETRDDAIACLQMGLRLDPANAEVRAQLQQLGVTPPSVPASEAVPTPSAPPAPVRVGDTTTYDEGVYEMLWDCKFCGTEKLLGKTHKFCPTCGATQDPEWRYFPSDDEKVAVKDHVFVGEDKMCPSCNSLMAGNVEFCTRCGAPQTEAARAKKLSTRTRGMNEKFDREDRDARQLAEARGLNAPAPKAKGRPWWVYGIILLVVGGIGFALFSIFAKRETVGTVQAFEWERSISIDAYSAVPGRSVCTSMPVDAYSVSRNYEQVGSRSVPDGEDCSMQQIDQGDGTFRQQRVCTTRYRQEPVYDYVCSYVVNRWTPSRTARNTGTKETALSWPDPALACGGGATRLGCERESGRNETYTLKFSAGEKRYDCAVPFNLWDNARLEQAFTFQVGIVFDNPDCSTVQPAGG